MVLDAVRGSLWNDQYIHGCGYRSILSAADPHHSAELLLHLDGTRCPSHGMGVHKTLVSASFLIDSPLSNYHFQGLVARKTDCRPRTLFAPSGRSALKGRVLAPLSILSLRLDEFLHDHPSVVDAAAKAEHAGAKGEHRQAGSNGHPREDWSDSSSHGLVCHLRLVASFAEAL